MLFNSTNFLLFFPIVVGIYFLMPSRWRSLHLLVSSYSFYCSWEPIFGLLLFFSTLINYFIGIRINNISRKGERKNWLILGIFLNLSILSYFKYANFFLESFISFLSIIEEWEPINVILPIGISFFTFQSIGYLVDIYQKKIPAEKHFGIFALFSSFFPQLVAGPIERAEKLIPQFKKLADFDWERVKSGLKKMLFGFFKKLVIADNLSPIVTIVFADPENFGGGILLMVTIMFAFQIYCDFSGYTDIAIGAARILGINLSENFRLPYGAVSIVDFWRKWHISLSNWFRDYLYIPLGGNRPVKVIWIRNILIVFGLSGLWHGANWTFLVWGLIHGSLYIGCFFFSKLNINLNRYLSICITFCVVGFTWIFFRAKSIASANFILSEIFFNLNLKGLNFLIDKVSLGILLLNILLIFLFILWDRIYFNIEKGKFKVSSFQDRFIHSSMLVSIFIFGYFGEIEFIYFKF